MDLQDKSAVAASTASFGILVLCAGALSLIIYTLVVRPRRTHADVQDFDGLKRGSAERHRLTSTGHAEHAVVDSELGSPHGEHNSSTADGSSPDSCDQSRSTSLFGENSLFSLDDADGLDWDQVKLASQRARNAKKSRESNAPRSHSDASSDLQPPLTRIVATEARETTFLDGNDTHSDPIGATALLPESTATFSAPTASPRSQLRAAAPAWIPSGLLLGTGWTTPAPSTPKKIRHHQLRTPKKRRNGTHLPRHTNVKSNPFAALDV